MASDREALKRLRESVEETWRAHRDKASSEYNDCESSECAWCQDTREDLETLEAALAAPPSAQDENTAKRKAVANCYMMAKREIARLRNSNAVDAISLERWQHVLRFCEESGEKSSILRDGLPTEITDGGARATPGDTP